jgi:hypothetical protein
MKTVDNQEKPNTPDQNAYVAAYIRAIQKADESDPYFRAYWAMELFEQFIPDCKVSHFTKYTRDFSHYQIHLNTGGADFVVEESVADVMSSLIFAFTKDEEDISEHAFNALTVFMMVYGFSLSTASNKEELEEALFEASGNFIEAFDELHSD